MSATTRSRSDSDALLALGALLLVVSAAGLFTVAAHLGSWLAGTGELPWHPVVLVAGLAKGQLVWPGVWGWVALAALAAPLLALTGGVWWLVARARKRRARVDVAAAHMGRGRDIAHLTTEGALRHAVRWGLTTPGVLIGTAVAGARRLWQNWESVAVWIMGPRAGKTTSAAVPAVLDAPGAVVATSNKRDLCDATRDPRAAAGAVWVFDPQSIVDEEPSWYWNPLGGVRDEVTALRLARVLVNAARDPGARTDAYFDKAGPSLIGNLLLAAALDGRPITQVYDWLCDPLEQEPVDVLEREGKVRAARAVRAVIRAPEKQRGGIYGTAQELLSFLVNDAAAAWVVPDDERPGFDPDAFAASTDTLYLLSREGDGSTGPLVTALAVAVTEAAERLARISPHGRLPAPMVLVLDEAANICRWHSLPDLYSHFGSRGIVVLTFLQSWSQGVDVWGREGMRKLWSAANVRVLGAGVSEDEFLSGLAKLVGTYRRRTRSGSAGGGKRTRSWSETDEQVLDVADLAALPPGRAVLFTTGTRPVLVRTVPWTTGPHAAAVEASILAHDPGAVGTLADAEREAEAWAAADDRDVPAAGAGWAA
jgi:type IV secretory pathway TraG/TraD family ATPase VirD4